MKFGRTFQESLVHLKADQSSGLESDRHLHQHKVSITYPLLFPVSI